MAEHDKPYSIKKDDRAKAGLSEDLDYRIKGLESAKLEPGMTSSDIAALDRAIEKLKRQKAEKAAAKGEKKDEDEV